jgi:hypothetical protein
METVRRTAALKALRNELIGATVSLYQYRIDSRYFPILGGQSRCEHHVHRRSAGKVRGGAGRRYQASGEILTMLRALNSSARMSM